MVGHLSQQISSLVFLHLLFQYLRRRAEAHDGAQLICNVT